MGLRAIAARFVRRDAVTRDGPYELRVRVVHRGTRSEGRIGRLLRDGVEVDGTEVGEVVDGPTRRFTFHGHDRPHLWSTSGWSHADAPTADAPAAAPAPGP